MNYASIALLIIFFGYTAISWAVLGPLDSLSESWYLWKDKKQYSAAFNIFGFLSLLACIFQYKYVDGLTLAMFVASGGFMWLLTVGSHYKEYNPHHIVPTLAAIFCGFAALFAEYGWGPKFWHPVWISFVLVLTIKVSKVPYSTTWAELILLVAILANFLVA